MPSRFIQVPQRAPKVTQVHAGRSTSAVRVLAAGLVALTAGQFGGGCSTKAPAPDTSTRLVYDESADLSSPTGFYAQPYPMDTRLSAGGTPDLRGFPIRNSARKLLAGVLDIAQKRPGFPTTAISYFQFTGSLSKHSPDDVIPAGWDAPVLLVDVTAASTDAGKLLPTVATQIEADEYDEYVPQALLAISPRPGFVLKPKHTYAVVVKRDFKDAAGASLGVNPTFLARLTGTVPAAAGAAAGGAKAPGSTNTGLAIVGTLLRSKGVDLNQVAAANVFTTGDVIEDTFALTERSKAAYSVTLTGLKVDPDDGNKHKDYCELVGEVTYPQFQVGTPPFNTEGLFELDSNGVPKKQRDEKAPVTIAIPNGPAPAAGIPMVVYFHGSGGQGNEAVDASKSTVAGQDGPKGEGPAAVMAPRGFAMAASSLPFSIDRFPGAEEQEYLNFNNLAAMRDTFRQGMIEQRLFIEALRTLRIPMTALAGCTGVTAPSGAQDIGFDPNSLYAMGQSMGGAYTNYISALEPRIKGAVPTGAGGFWTYFVLNTEIIPNANGALSLLMGVKGRLTFLHPALNLVQTAWESVDPLVFVPRVARMPLANHSPVPVYEPVGKGDRYFPISTFDYMALGYGNQQAGNMAWPSMQDALKLQDKAGILPYPVEGNLTSDTGAKTTGVVVQYEGDGIANAHAIYRQLDAVKYQYSCFLTTLQRGGTGKVLAPQPLASPCN
jgi:hypothetical protein